ncbi:uncharacterized protein LY79DRAFT_553382 [Colletotrichum navitas]|uniref:Uncharacterized protein n=1 Tax=Colletotrichum navitas TaxID=681940 RepID=A0AAD8V5Y6_9PEZI|nr:uncharacterized protein LY79DRAFT_553382 [Colletotrichum navitas]KAK1590869.1 hypothetical protein LY79DRAFT_553382 [Colletotrichum navitas]
MHTAPRNNQIASLLPPFPLPSSCVARNKEFSPSGQSIWFVDDKNIWAMTARTNRTDEGSNKKRRGSAGLRASPNTLCPLVLPLIKHWDTDAAPRGVMQVDKNERHSRNTITLRNSLTLPPACHLIRQPTCQSYTLRRIHAEREREKEEVGYKVGYTDTGRMPGYAHAIVSLPRIWWCRLPTVSSQQM